MWRWRWQSNTERFCRTVVGDHPSTAVANHASNSSLIVGARPDSPNAMKDPDTDLDEPKRTPAADQSQDVGEGEPPRI